jgi:hypothetical protein
VSAKGTALQKKDQAYDSAASAAQTAQETAIQKKNQAYDTAASAAQSARDTAIQKKDQAYNAVASAAQSAQQLATEKANQAYEYAGQTYQAAKDTVTNYTNTASRKIGEAWEGTVTPPAEAADKQHDAVLGSADHEPIPSGDVVGATEKVESWDLSEAVAKTAGDENKDLKLKVSEEGAPPGGDAEDAPVVSIGSIKDSAAGELVSGSPQEKAEDSEHTGGVTEAPSEVVDVSPETPAEGSVENDAPVEATKSAEPDEGSGSLEAMPSDDVEAKSGEVETFVKERREVASKEDLSLLPAETQSGSVCDKFNFRVEVVVNDLDNIKQVIEQLVLQAVFPEFGMS